ncbi:DUF3040 domain-containing protein [Gordonia amarae]|uniref:Uncharacterized protein n=2 Tax=Gordonia amarae TaxID=36821 RepID=G7GJV6_9ACTN|nr:hypothetical protein [Gordonia amarae]MCS3879722.1 peptidoglycan/LPS O-acetylase OafA/YrhL [Gordonia amarae]QHN18160.1 DUF3040 domain-containing protein [Gordonia amarae]QHN31547.1 DUF3040 domain-containing protein [Gordonia amarae]QHN40291.1 DUF3040 domain-containing protein [Gordonia amarae]GAB03881.1 hypothetical protein GOAMR_06_00870 [Gordonia amarae NBRC 15530]
MTTLAELLGTAEPLPTTTPIEDQEKDGDDMKPQAPQSLWLGALIALAVLAGIAAIVLGIALGGPWRWASGAAVAVGIAAIVVPGVVDGKGDKGTEEDQR